MDRANFVADDSPQRIVWFRVYLALLGIALGFALFQNESSTGLGVGIIVIAAASIVLEFAKRFPRSWARFPSSGFAHTARNPRTQEMMEAITYNPNAPSRAGWRRALKWAALAAGGIVGLVVLFHAPIGVCIFAGLCVVAWAVHRALSPD